VALSAKRLAEWMASDLSKLDLLVIQIDGLRSPITLRALWIWHRWIGVRAPKVRRIGIMAQTPQES
jgi:hypothetical protein